MVIAGWSRLVPTLGFTISSPQFVASRILIRTLLVLQSTNLSEEQKVEVIGNGTLQNSVYALGDLRL